MFQLHENVGYLLLLLSFQLSLWTLRKNWFCFSMVVVDQVVRREIFQRMQSLKCSFAIPWTKDLSVPWASWVVNNFPGRQTWTQHCPPASSDELCNHQLCHPAAHPLPFKRHRTKQGGNWRRSAAVQQFGCFIPQCSVLYLSCIFIRSACFTWHFFFHSNYVEVDSLI